MIDASKKAQRKRRKAGFEEVRALVYLPDFIAWLVWDGWLDAGDVGEPAAIRTALADFLREQYRHIGEENYDPPPQYAHGSFGAEFTALRDGAHKAVVGLLEREGAHDWRDPPTRQLITRRTAALRRTATLAEPPPTYDLEFPDPDREPVTVMPGIWNGEPCGAMPWQPDEEPIPPDDYDPEADMEKDAADLSDGALAEHFDADGYEKD